MLFLGKNPYNYFTDLNVYNKINNIVSIYIKKGLKRWIINYTLNILNCNTLINNEFIFINNTIINYKIYRNKKLKVLNLKKKNKYYNFKFSNFILLKEVVKKTFFYFIFFKNNISNNYQLSYHINIISFNSNFKFLFFLKKNKIDKKKKKILKSKNNFEMSLMAININKTSKYLLKFVYNYIKFFKKKKNFKGFLFFYFFNIFNDNFININNFFNFFFKIQHSYIKLLLRNKKKEIHIRLFLCYIS